MLDTRNNTLRLGDMVAYATTTRPGRNTHAVLKIGTVKKIAMGKREEYVLIEVVEDGWVSRAVIREKEKLIKIGDGA